MTDEPHPKASTPESVDYDSPWKEMLEQQFEEAVLQYEEERKMQYVTSFERRGIEKGRLKGRLEQAQESVVEVLQTRFENVPVALIDAVNRSEDLTFLKVLVKKAVTVSSVEEFEQELLCEIKAET